MYGAMLLLSALMALGTHGPVYHVAMVLVPPLQGLRAPARFGMMVALALAVLAGVGAARLLGRAPLGWRRHALGAVLVACLAVEYASQVGPLHAWVQREPIYAAWLRMQPPGAVVDLPIARAYSLPHYEAEWSFYGRTHRHPMVNGYSGYFPKRYIDLLGVMIAFPRGESLAALRAHGVRYVVVHEDRYEPADFIDFDGRLRRTPGPDAGRPHSRPGLSGHGVRAGTLRVSHYSVACHEPSRLASSTCRRRRCWRRARQRRGRGHDDGDGRSRRRGSATRCRPSR